MSPALDASLRLLDLDDGASLSDAKKARRELAMIWHPDRFPESEVLRTRAEEKLKQINSAYELVSDHLRASAPKKALHASPEAQEAPASASKTVTLPGVPVESLALTHSVGLMVGGDRFAEVIAAGTTVPCASAKTFTNARDFQSELTVHLKHGDASAPASSASGLGRVTFVDLPPGPRGFLRMQVVFAVDEKGTVAVGATDLDSGEPVLATTA
ncbi:MAG: Hsp70 family protein [Bacteroidota bacterium]